MASTNKTTNYELSQFVGSDKPAWLSDYNQDMSKIDAGIHSASTTATGADGKADANATSIGDISQLSTTSKTSLVSAVNEVNTLAGTAQETANTASTVATQGKNKADELAEYLTLNVSSTPAVNVNVGTLASGTTVSVRTNSTGSLAKIYSTNITVSNLENNTGTLTLTIADTGLRPSEAITFNGCAFVRVRDKNNGIYRQLSQGYTLNTDGTITISRSLSTLSASELMFQFVACLLFVTDFGDVEE